ncbi:hypothetical protein K8T06_05340, partial [bacterium]|nr:hypothetical protein [bacterium]
GNHTPWSLLARLPAVSGMRVPARSVLIVVFAVAMLFGRAVWILCSHLKNRKYTWLICSIFIALIMLENLPLIPVEPAIVKKPEVYQWLDSLPDDSPVAEAPSWFGTDLWAFSADYMMFAALHGHPIANGYSRYVPDGFSEVSGYINSLPSPNSIRSLKDLGIEYVIIHPQKCFNKIMMDLFQEMGHTDQPIEIFNRIILMSNDNYSNVTSPEGQALESACLKSPYMDLVFRSERDLIFRLRFVPQIQNQGSQPKDTESI